MHTTQSHHCHLRHLPASLVAAFLLSFACLLPSRNVSAADFFDDFNDGNDEGWTSWAANRFNNSFTVENGVYQIRANSIGSDYSRAGVFRRDLSMSDFHLSVDVLDWNRDPGAETGISLVARFSETPLRSYVLAFAPNVRSDANQGYILLWKRDATLSGDPILLGQGKLKFTIDKTKQYRMVFTGKGSNLTGALYALDNLITPIARIKATDSGIASGFVGLYGVDDTTQFRANGAPLDFKVDNFRASSTVPTEIIADFDAAAAPDFRPWEGNRASAKLTFERGGYRLQASSIDQTPGIVAVLADGDQLNDFHLSVDILDWDDSVAGPTADLSLIARYNASPFQLYGMAFVPRSILDPTRGVLVFWRHNELTGGYFEDMAKGGTFLSIDPAKQYRLEFIGKGSHFEGRLHTLDNLEVPVAAVSFTDTQLASGSVGMVAENAPLSLKAKVDFLVDNFRASSSLPQADLSIEPAVRLSWSGWADQAIVESAGSVNGPWSAIQAVSEIEGGRRVLFVQSQGQARFFRLRQP